MAASDRYLYPRHHFEYSPSNSAADVLHPLRRPYSVFVVPCAGGFFPDGVGEEILHCSSREEKQVKNYLLLLGMIIIVLGVTVGAIQLSVSYNEYQSRIQAVGAPAGSPQTLYDVVKWQFARLV